MRAVGIAPNRCTHAIARFQGLPHRLRLIGQNQGIRYIDDSISTTPESALAAIHSFYGHKITLLLGGFDRGLSYTHLCRFLLAHPIHAVITMPETGVRIAETLRRENKNRLADMPFLLREAKDLGHAVDIAKKITPEGGIILLSPAAPSYGHFNNFEERGQAFAAAAGF
jgi:UDP-N-acetylmuramoylalanine-D-glutamate ligase